MPLPAEPPAAAASAPAFANGAYTEQGEYSVPSGPPLSLATPACLTLADPLLFGGTWTIRYHVVVTPNGREHWTEHLDYSQVFITAGSLSWHPGPGAHEQIIWIGDSTGPRNVMHQFNAHYVSQDGSARPNRLSQHTLRRRPGWHEAARRQRVLHRGLSGG